MSGATCSQCGFTGSLRSFYELNGKIYCEPCVWKAARESEARGENASYISLGYGTACARCQKDSGIELPRVGDAPLCPECHEYVYAYPYPRWLKLSLVLLVLLLVVALVNGKKYFHAGKALYRGERLISEGRYPEAVSMLSETVQVAPESDKGVLLYAKASLKAGDAGRAYEAIKKHKEGKFEDASDPLFQEVEQILGRVDRAYGDAEKAVNLAKQAGHAKEALQMMQQAAAEYPESVTLAQAVPQYDISLAFETKDYDRFVQLARQQSGLYPESAYMAAQLASALACKYAVTGDRAFQDQALAALEKAHGLARSEEDRNGYQEYSERILHRLKSREIIDKDEYDRRFRKITAPE